MTDLPLEELLAIENPTKRRDAFLTVLQAAARSDGHTAAMLVGDVAAWLHDRYRSASLVPVATDDEESVAAQLEAWAYTRIGHSFVHPMLMIDVHVVEVPSLPNCRLRTSTGNLTEWEPDQTCSPDVCKALEERRDEISEAISVAGKARSDLYLASGKLEIIEPRRWRLHLGQEKILEYLRRQST